MLAHNVMLAPKICTPDHPPGTISTTCARYTRNVETPEHMLNAIPKCACPSNDVCLYVCVTMYVCSFVCMYACVCMYVCMYACMCVCLSVCVLV